MSSEAGVDRGQAGGARQLTAILPNGRTVWLRVNRPLSPLASATDIARLAERSIERRASRNTAQARAIARRSAGLVAAAAIMERARLARARALRRRVVASHKKLDRRLLEARDAFRARLDKQLKVDREGARRLRRRDLWDKVLMVTSLPLFVAYGDRKNPFGSHNLTLSFLMLLWLAGDHVVEAVFGSHSKSPYAVPDADAWSYLAPIGNVLAAWWLLGDRQHQRFVTGVTTVKLEKPARGTIYRYRVTVSLSDYIATGHFEDFATFDRVPAVATIGSLRLSNDGRTIDARIDRLSARVIDGHLTLSLRVVPQKLTSPLPADLGDVDIAWMVDTDRPSTARTGS